MKDNLRELLDKDLYTDKLEIEQRVYVPSTQDGDKEIPSYKFEKRIEEVEKKLSKLFGGYTEIRTTGGWLSDSKGLIKEKVAVVVSYADIKTFNKNKKRLLKWLKKKKQEWGQEAIGYEVEGDLYLI